MEEMNIEDESIFDKYVKDFNYKDYIVYNYCMIDVKDTSKLNEVKSDVENNIKDLIAVTDIKDSASYSVYQGEIEEGETYV